jgi:hypothetical protein
MEMTYTDKAILELLNNPKIIPPNDIIHEYTVASHNDVELLVIKVILNIDVNNKGYLDRSDIFNLIKSTNLLLNSKEEPTDEDIDAYFTLLSYNNSS